MTKRTSALAKRFDELGIDGFIVAKPENRMYMTGFSGSAGFAYIDRSGHCLLSTDSRYDPQAFEEAAECEVVIARGTTTAMDVVCQRALASGANRVGIEEEFVSVATKAQLERKLQGVTLCHTGKAIEKQRAVKDEDEIAAIRRAVEIADQAFTAAIAVIKPGVREIEVALELEYAMRKLGALRPAFDTIIASGHRSAMAHGKASEKRIAPGEPVVMDFGACYGGYMSDMTRTVSIGQMNAEMTRIYSVVLEAQVQACSLIKAGISGRTGDSYAREVIERAGYGELFGHGLGHGVGLEVHEYPSMSYRTEEPLVPGMVVSVEPGIYIAGRGGVRIEDLVVIRDNGVEILTSSPKEHIAL